MLGIEMDISARKNIEEALMSKNQELADGEKHLAQLSIFYSKCAKTTVRTSPVNCTTNWGKT